MKVLLKSKSHYVVQVVGQVSTTLDLDGDTSAFSIDWYDPRGRFASTWNRRVRQRRR
jgi:hypothetical protein